MYLKHFINFFSFLVPFYVFLFLVFLVDVNHPKSEIHF